MMRKAFRVLLVVVFVFSAAVARAQSAADDESNGERPDSTQYARQLTTGDAPTRQAAAEALARLAAVEQRKLVESYVLQEKDKRVRLALNWALYRMGRSETLFQIVRELDSPRNDQALDYLTQLESPEPLYLFLKQENTAPRVTERLLQVLGESGNAETIEKIKPLVDHYDQRVSAAAKVAIEQIQNRLSQPADVIKGRPRKVTRDKEPLQNRER
jgi:hypothetical protein